MATDPSSSSSHEFRVHKVRRSRKRQAAEPLQESLRHSVGGEIESSSIVADAEVLSRIGCYHAVLGAVYTAYSLHYPLVLSPDALWITIGQGIAHHMVIHGAEWRRGNDCGTQADKTLRLKTTTNDNTDDTTESWCTAIRDHVGSEWADLLTGRFSTTTQTDRTVGHVVLMDVFRRYYNQERISICGIPSVTLEGTVDDYELLRQKTRTALKKLNMDWWLQDLEPILDQFVQARSGNIDSKHWKNICKHEEAYGGAIVNGWIAKFFPYLRSFIRGPCRERNPAIGAPEGEHPGFSTMVAPSGLSRVLFEEEEEVLVQKELVAGFLGVTQDPKTLALRPLAGWVVRKASKEDALAQRLIREEKQSTTEWVSLGETPMDERHLLGISSTNKNGEGDFPEDLYRLHYQLKDVRVGPIRLLTPKGDLQGWSKIAELEDGRVVVADLDVSVRDPRLPKEDFFSYDPSFCVIGVCGPREWEGYDDCVEEEEKDNNHTTLLQGVVVAYSVVDWLEQSLDWAASSMHQEHSCYWDAPDYVPLGDLQNPTRYYDEKNARERNTKKKKKAGILTVLKKVLKQSYS